MPSGGAMRGKGQHYQWLKDRVSYVGEECLIWPFTRNWNGYGMLGVEGKVTYAHRTMCRLVHGDPPTPKHVAAHSCNNGPGACCHPKHLLWKTPRENLLDRRAAGTNTTKRWNKHGTLTLEQMAEIKALKGEKNQREIAEMFGITYQHVSAIQNGRVAGGDKGKRFTADEVRHIRGLKGRRATNELADEYGVSYHVIYKMQTGRSYRGV